MNEERVAIDESLISTDVDRLIHIISDKKRIEVAMLQRESSINRKVIDTWLKVLEDEGYIRLDYTFTSTYAIWLGEEPEEVEKKVEQKEIVQGHLEQHIPEAEKPEADEEFLIFPEDKATEKEAQKTEETVHPKKEPEEPELATAESVPEDVEPLLPEKAEEREHEEDPKHNILETIKEEEPETPPENTESTITEIPEQPVEAETTEPELLETEEVEDEPKEVVAEKRERNIKAAVSKYLDEINKEKATIEALKREKGYIHRKKYLSLENKMESDITSITERVLEKEGRIIELREKILDLPDKVEELDKLQQTMKKVETEGRSTLAKTRNKVNSFLGELKSTKDSIAEKMEKNRALLQAERQKSVSLENMLATVDNTLESANARINEAKAKIDEMNQSIQAMFDELENVTDLKTEVNDMTSGITNSIDRKEDELEGLMAELDEIAKVEQWVSEYLNDYEQKVAEIEKYVGEGEEEIDKLREASESEYLRRYLSELENLTASYEQELDEVVAEEKDIDAQIAETKGRLDRLLEESKNMLRKYHKEGPQKGIDTFSVVIKRAREKADRIKRTVEEKSKEREKLKDDTREVKDRKKKRVEEIKVKSRERRRDTKRKEGNRLRTAKSSFF